MEALTLSLLLLAAVLAAPLTYWILGSWGVYVAILCGLIGGCAIGYFTEYYTSDSYPKVKEIASESQTGHATNIIAGFSTGMESTLLTVLVLVVVAFMVILSLFSMIASGGRGGTGSVAPSTVQREPLPASAAETGYYTDELGWILNERQLLSGMKAFYRETGVQPYLYITDNINGSYEPTAQEIGEYAAALYEQLFTDEGHFLLIYQEYDGYMAGYTAGAQAKSVMDNEAVAILQGYLDLYNTSDLTDEEYFGQVFQKTGERIMTVTKSPWPVVGGIFGMLLLVALCFFWWKKHKEQKNLEAQQLQEMLNTPLTTFGNDQDGNGRDDAEDLAEKYERTEKAPDSTGTGES